MKVEITARLRLPAVHCYTLNAKINCYIISVKKGFKKKTDYQSAELVDFLYSILFKSISRSF